MISTIIDEFRADNWQTVNQGRTIGNEQKGNRSNRWPNGSWMGGGRVMPITIQSVSVVRFESTAGIIRGLFGPLRRAKPKSHYNSTSGPLALSASLYIVYLIVNLVNIVNGDVTEDMTKKTTR